MSVIARSDKLNLTLESTLQELPLWDVHVEIDSPGNDLIRLFEQEPLLPGVILTKSKYYFGMISRRQFFEKMSSRFSLELYSQRSIEVIYKKLQPAVVEFNEDTSVIAATQMMLQRTPQYVYEPIVVKTAQGRYKVVDFHSLLLAYSQIYVLTLTELQQAKEQSKIARTNVHNPQHNDIQLVQKENKQNAALGQEVVGLFASIVHNEISDPIKFITGKLIHANRSIHKLLQLINLYQKHYPQPVQEIQNTINQIELGFLTAEIPKLLTSIKDASKHIQQIISSLRNFLRLEQAEKKTADIHEGLDMTLLILQSRLKPEVNSDQSITIIKEYGNISLVECYAEQLNQVFMYILSNAIDALELEMKNQNSRMQAKQNQIAHNKSAKPLIRIQTEMPDPTHVVIRIADNGPGMTEEIKQQIFTPFFTTKLSGNAIGIGLSISYQIVVEKHHGQLDCVSTVGQGTEFIIKVPVYTY